MLTTGDTIAARWTIVRRLGAGGIGSVYLCDDADTGEQVAVKVVVPPSERLAERLGNRLEREASILAKLRHDGIVRLLDHGSDPTRGLFYLVMDAVRGREVDRETVLDGQGNVDYVRLRALLNAIDGALAFAHEAKVAHRDLKLQNILVRQSDGRPVLVDWGSVYTAEDERLTRFHDSHALGRTDLYAPPEALFHPASADPFLWDVYAMGVLTFVLLRGEEALHPNLDDRHALLIAKTTGPLDPGEGVPEALREAVKKATAPLPDQRCRSIKAFERLLDGWQAAPPPERPITFFVEDEVAPHGATAIPRGADVDLLRSDKPWAGSLDERRHSADVPSMGTYPATGTEEEPAPRRAGWLLPVTGVAAALAVVVALLVRSPGPEAPPPEAPTPTVAAPAAVEPPAAAPDEGVPPPAAPAQTSGAAPAATTPSPTTPAIVAPPPSGTPVVEPPTPAPPKPTPPAGADTTQALLERLLAVPEGDLADTLASNPADAAAAVDAFSRTWPDEERQELATRLRRRVVADMNAKVGDGSRLVDTLAQKGRLVALLGSSRYGQGADFKVGLRLRMAERMPDDVRNPTQPRDCTALAEVVDVLGREPVPDAHPWLREACATCTLLTGAPVGKCGAL